MSFIQAFRLLLNTRAPGAHTHHHLHPGISTALLGHLPSGWHAHACSALSYPISWMAWLSTNFALGPVVGKCVGSEHEHWRARACTSAFVPPGDAGQACAAWRSLGACARCLGAHLGPCRRHSGAPQRTAAGGEMRVEAGGPRSLSAGDTLGVRAAPHGCGNARASAAAGASASSGCDCCIIISGGASRAAHRPEV